MSPTVSVLFLGQMLVLPLVVAVGLYLRARKPEMLRPRRHAELRLQLKAMAPRQRFQFLAVIVAFFGFFFWISHERKSAQAEILRRQLLIPGSVAIADVSISRHSSVKRPRIEAIAHFTRQQLDEYTSKLDDPGLWQPVLSAYGDIPIMAYSAEALRWMPPPAPAFAGDRRINFGNLSLNADIRVRNGRVLCFALQGQFDGRQPKSFHEQPSHYIAKACSEYERRETVGTYFLAVLDFDTGTLHMAIR